MFRGFHLGSDTHHSHGFPARKRTLAKFFTIKATAYCLTDEFWVVCYITDFIFAIHHYLPIEGARLKSLLLLQVISSESCHFEVAMPSHGGSPEQNWVEPPSLLGENP